MKSTSSTYLRLGLPLLGLTGVLACGSPGPIDAGAGVEVVVAPLDLPRIGDAAYTIRVLNALGDVVWHADDLHSDQYGDGAGALTYVGPCDAQQNPHRVELVLDALWDEDMTLLQSPADYVNPTLKPNGEQSPIVLTGVICRENADTLVEFNLTILRSADQGFFDIGVNFADVFCSAKVDCRDAFLHDLAPGDGERGPTAIMTLACTTGRDTDGAATPTTLYLSQVELQCTDPSAPSAPPEVFVIPLANVGNGEAVPANAGVFGTAVYAGAEELPGYDKCYVNTAIGLDVSALSGKKCELVARATAAEDTWSPPLTPAGHVWPVIEYRVEVLSPTGALCDNNALNAAGSGVQTRYSMDETGAIAPEAFDWSYRCGAAAPTPAEFVCAGQTIRGTGDSGVAVGGVTYDLPVGATIGGCCASTRCEMDVPGGAATFASLPGGLAFTPSGGPDGAYDLPSGASLVGCCDAGCCDAPSAPSPPPVPERMALAAGVEHTCELQSSGGASGPARCWGRNWYGQAVPDEPNGGFIAIAAGSNHTCALRLDGAIACWGLDRFGQATPPLYNQGYVAIAAANATTCAIQGDDGSIVCWGRLPYQGIYPPSDGQRFVAIAGRGGERSAFEGFCALREDSSIACWGSGIDAPPPTVGFTALSVGVGHACGLSSDGSVACWGLDGSGQASPPAGSFSAVAAGGDVTCAIGAGDGQLVCWGGDDWGQATPPAGTGFTEITMGEYHGCARNAAGLLECWGWNRGGQGDAPRGIAFTALDARWPVAIRADGAVTCLLDSPCVSVSAGVEQVAAGGGHACLLDAAGVLTCWGDDQAGQATPPTAPGFTALAAGTDFTCALDGDGGIVCWGDDSIGQLQSPTDSGGYKAIAALGQTACALRVDGTPECWGDDASGQATPPSVTGLTMLSLSDRHACALGTDGAAVCWGAVGYDYGQTTPPSDSGFVAIAAGAINTCALRANGSVACWGASWSGDTTPPAAMTFTALSAANFNIMAGVGGTCGLRTDGAIVCWGARAAKVILP